MVAVGVGVVDAVVVVFEVLKLIIMTPLRKLTVFIKSEYPHINLGDAWTYKYSSGLWKFYGPDNFSWKGEANNAYDARYSGWLNWLVFKRNKNNFSLELNGVDNELPAGWENSDTVKLLMEKSC